MTTNVKRLWAKNWFRSWDTATKLWMPDFCLSKDGKVLVLNSLGIYEQKNSAIPSQCSGLCDKKGNPIFEGDIVTFDIYNEYGSFESVFALMRFIENEGKFSFELSRPYKLTVINNLKGVDIVSNIFEDPDFLEKNDPILKKDKPFPLGS